ncbi:MAG: hypothetical protein J6S75_00150 [Thermoguttaceae bacterium]|nr:hypothetical protein [Thermoguttaceae bacterium]
MMNARKQPSGVIVTPAAYLRNRKRVLNLKIILHAMIISTGCTITSWLKSSIDPIKTATAYYSMAALGQCELEFANAAICLVSQLETLDLWRRVFIHHR